MLSINLVNFRTSDLGFLRQLLQQSIILIMFLAAAGIAVPRMRYGLFLRAMRIAFCVTFFYELTGHRTSVPSVAVFLACQGANSSRRVSVCG